MAVTFSNAQFLGDQASQGAVALGLYTGTSLTGGVGVTAVTINGTIDRPGSSTVSVDLNAAGLVAVGAVGTYLGFNSINGHTEYYFAVTGGGLVTPVTIAVAGTTLPAVQAAVPVTTSVLVTAPNDPGIPNDVTPPAFTSAVANGNSLVLTYGETLSTSGPLPTAFAVTAGGSAVAVTAATVSGSAVTLTLATPVANGQAVTVAYTDPTAGNDLLAVQDIVGNDAATLAPTAVTNTTPDTTPPLFQSATVAGNTLVLSYGETLSALSARCRPPSRSRPAAAPWPSRRPPSRARPSP